MDQLVGYRPCSFKHDGDAELCPATQPTARRALKLTAGSPRHTAIPHRPTTNGLPFFPYHPPATSPSSAASLNARRLLHSIPIAPPRFRPTAFLPQCSPNRGPALISTLTLGETAERILFVGLLPFAMKWFIASLALLITFSLGVACGSLWMKPRNSTTTTQTNSTIPPDTFITLERTGCYGTCPSYTLAISADGTTIFSASYFAKVNGTNQWKKSGVIKSRVTEDQIRQLISEFNRANYFSLRDRYRDVKDGCPTESTDMSSAYTSFQMNGRKKSIDHYLGCFYDDRDLTVYPKELFALENSIDRIV